jgi:hypothetical protein
MKWIIVILSVNASGHSYIANSSWMDANQGYPTLEASQFDIAKQQAFHRKRMVARPQYGNAWR